MDRIPYIENGKIQSALLDRIFAFHLILPTHGKDWPLLCLLHGAMEDGNTILHRSDIVKMVEEKNIAVLIPDMGNCFYIDGYGEFIATELIPAIRNSYLVSNLREYTWIAGISMGGYGAFYIASRHSELFSKVASISGSFDLSFGFRFVRNCGGVLPEDIGDLKQYRAPDYDICHLMDNGNGQEYFLACGLKDVLVVKNRKFVDALRAKGLAIHYEESDGSHDWEYWPGALESMISWL